MSNRPVIRSDALVACVCVICGTVAAMGDADPTVSNGLFTAAVLAMIFL